MCFHNCIPDAHSLKLVPVGTNIETLILFPVISVIVYWLDRSIKRFGFYLCDLKWDPWIVHEIKLIFITPPKICLFVFSGYNMQFNFCWVIFSHLLSEETFTLGAGWDNGMYCPSAKKGWPWKVKVMLWLKWNTPFWNLLWLHLFELTAYLSWFV